MYRTDCHTQSDLIEGFSTWFKAKKTCKWTYKAKKIKTHPILFNQGNVPSIFEVPLHDEKLSS